MVAARAERAQSMVELALTLPIIVFGLLGGADLARAFALQLAVQNGARAGAEAAAINQSPTTALAIARARDELARTPGINSLEPVITATFKQADGATDCVDPPTAALPCFATVRVTYTFRTITAWPLVPNTANFDRTTVMRTMAKGS